MLIFALGYVAGEQAEGAAPMLPIVHGTKGIGILCSRAYTRTFGTEWS